MDKINSKSEVKIIENEHIYKNLISHILSCAFLVNFEHISHNVFLFLLLLFLLLSLFTVGAT